MVREEVQEQSNGPTTASLGSEDIRTELLNRSRRSAVKNIDALKMTRYDWAVALMPRRHAQKQSERSAGYVPVRPVDERLAAARIDNCLENLYIFSFEK